MSRSPDSSPELTSTPAAPAPSPGRSPRLVLAWCVGASLLLAASGAIRAVQAARQQDDKDFQAQCPFPLKELPRNVGDWHVPKNSEVILDDLTIRITGSTDHVIWKYEDDMTGTALSVLVLYGPAEPVVPHTPQVCYPATGYQATGPTVDRAIKVDDREIATFRSSVYAKSGGRDLIQSIVYHSFWLDGVWSPAIANRRFPRRSPGVFKVQIQRRVVDGESRVEATEPIEQFLQAFLPAIDAKIAATRQAQASAVASR